MRIILFLFSSENYSDTVAAIYTTGPLAKNKGGCRCRR